MTSFERAPKRSGSLSVGGRSAGASGPVGATRTKHSGSASAAHSSARGGPPTAPNGRGIVEKRSTTGWRAASAPSGRHSCAPKRCTASHTRSARGNALYCLQKTKRLSVSSPFIPANSREWVSKEKEERRTKRNKDRLRTRERKKERDETRRA